MKIKIGAWIHDYDDLSLGGQIALAAENGLQTIRSYHIGYAEKAAPALRQTGLSLLAGMPVDAKALVEDWRTQVRIDELAHYLDLGVPLEAVCVGNELREGGDEPGKKRFTARISFGLANVLSTYRGWLDEHGHATPLTYAIEGALAFDRAGRFVEWLWPLVDACDVVSLNLYPMDASAWFSFGAFEESRRLLCDPRTRHDRFVLFEWRLRQALQELEQAGKPIILSETGFTSATGYRREGDRLVIPESDNAHFGAAMREFTGLIHRVNAEYCDRIQALYFYEWRDNLYHPKIWNVEQSPIHVAFGLCDRFGVPKFEVKRLVSALKAEAPDEGQ